MLFSEDTWEAPKWFEHVKYEMLTRHLLDIPGSGPNLPFLSLLSPSLYANPPPSCPVPEWPTRILGFLTGVLCPQDNRATFLLASQGPTSQTSGHVPDGRQQHPALSWPCRNLQAGGKGRECTLKREW